MQCVAGKSHGRGAAIVPKWVSTLTSRLRFPGQALTPKLFLPQKAATIGPVYSRPMMDFLKTNAISQNLIAAVEACRAHGIDVEMWAAVKAFVCMAGAVAEAQFTNRPLREIANGYEWENDLGHATRYCLSAGMTRQEASKVCNNALNWAREVFDDSSKLDRRFDLSRQPTVRRAHRRLSDSKDHHASHPRGHERQL